MAIVTMKAALFSQVLTSVGLIALFCGISITAVFGDRAVETTRLIARGTLVRGSAESAFERCESRIIGSQSMRAAHRDGRLICGAHRTGIGWYYNILESSHPGEPSRIRKSIQSKAHEVGQEIPFGFDAKTATVLPVQGSYPTRFRVESRNLGAGLNFDLNVSEIKRRSQFVDIMRRDVDTDVFLFQELSPDMREYVTEMLSDRYHIIMPDPGTNSANAVFIRKRPGVWTVSDERVVLSESLHRTFDQNGWTRSGWVTVDVLFDGHRYRFFSVHLASELKPHSVAHRAADVAKLIDEIERTRAEGLTAIVGGDFNIDAKQAIDPTRGRADRQALALLTDLAAVQDLNKRATCLFADYDHILVYPADPAVAVSRLTSYSYPSAWQQTDLSGADHRRIRADLEFIFNSTKPGVDTVIAGERRRQP